MIKQRKKTREDIRRVQELRRGNAARRHKSPKDYDRKDKSWKKEW